MLSPIDRCALIIELADCERRAEELKIRTGEVDPPAGAEERAQQTAIAKGDVPRAEARIDALEHRCQEILEELWPIGDRGTPPHSMGVV